MDQKRSAESKRGCAMTKRDLVVRISEETGLIQQDVYTVIQKTLDYIVEGLTKGETIEFRNFGVFEVRTRKQRIGRNPNKPVQVVTIPERKVVKFKPGKIMKQLITDRPQDVPPSAPAPSSDNPV
ncbi:MAG TPA: HU family DNA-binding protein [Kiritimatiellia bacterium]|nr:HU family DNA-binding protein [Kiritimatiellia bacterium]